MAEYEKYAEKYLDEEIKSAAEAQEQRKSAPTKENAFSMPDQFKGKSAEDIARSYKELQALQSRQASELGEMRQTVSNLVASQADLISSSHKTGGENAESEQRPPVSIDSLYDNPEAAIAQVAKETVNSEIKDLKEQLAISRQEREIEKLTIAHPNWKDTVATPEFSNWVEGNAYRTRLAKAADSFDLEAADALFSMYEDTVGTKASTTITADAIREQNLKDAMLESTGPAPVALDESFSRSNIIQAKMAAKMGDNSAKAWLANNAEAIRLAYIEDRTTN